METKRKARWDKDQLRWIERNIGLKGWTGQQAMVRLIELAEGRGDHFAARAEREQGVRRVGALRLLLLPSLVHQRAGMPSLYPPSATMEDRGIIDGSSLRGWIGWKPLLRLPPFS